MNFKPKLCTYLHNFAHICTEILAKYLQEILQQLNPMATTKLYLDTRATSWGEEAPLKLTITHKAKPAMLNLNIRLLPSQWDAKALKIINHPQKLMLNSYITRRKLDADNAILELAEQGRLGTMSAKDIRDYIAELKAKDDAEVDDIPNDVLFATRFAEFADKKEGRTKQVYLLTLSRMSAYDKKLQSRTFADIDTDWLNGFDAYMAKTSPSKNARNVHLRNIRAVFNDVIDDGENIPYPFRKFKIKPVATVKRNLTVEQLRELFNYPVEEHQRKYLDMFKLIFMLIGINVIDLVNLKGISPSGRVEYYRAKTGRLYSIKVEPEAMEIINLYKGTDYLLNVRDTYNHHEHYIKRINRALQCIGEITKGKNNKYEVVKPIYPTITTYWARHSWATIASSLDIPKDTIAAALGHGRNTVTDIYIDFDEQKIDEANRRVLNWVLYCKK